MAQHILPNTAAVMLIIAMTRTTSSFSPTPYSMTSRQNSFIPPLKNNNLPPPPTTTPLSLLHATPVKDDETEDTSSSGKRFTAASIEQTQINIRSAQDENKDPSTTTESSGAAINTVNERLMAEINAAANQEKYGKSSSASPGGTTDGAGGARPNPFFSKTEEERQRSIEEARDLNGINPLIALGGSVFAFGGAYGLWTLTNFLAALFASHPVTTDVYTLQRIAAVFRNVVMGLTSLASGFFLVTGLGIFLLGVRVAYGVSTGELDPTPIKPKKGEEIVLPNVWDLMMGKKPNRRGGGSDNPFL